ncbi:MAG: HAD-IA family hydrolase [Legionellaceae bacterium]|nr:HAD-IA family hydrolase [Legionellaceae bacterium]
MKTQYDLVVFDWEGTIAEDTFGNIVSVISKEADRFELTSFDKFIARQYVPLGLSAIVSKLFPDLSMHQREQFIAVVQEELNRSAQGVCLTAGVERAIASIHSAGLKLAIATNKSQKPLQRVLELSGLKDYFPVSRTATEVPAKPCPQMLEEIIEECDSTFASTIMVGDSLSDIEMAKSIGVAVVGVDFYHDQKQSFEDAGASLVIDDYDQLLEYLNISKGDEV